MAAAISVTVCVVAAPATTSCTYDALPTVTEMVSPNAAVPAMVNVLTCLTPMAALGPLAAVVVATAEVVVWVVDCVE